jgi:hypothetical protein
MPPPAGGDKPPGGLAPWGPQEWMSVEFPERISIVIEPGGTAQTATSPDAWLQNSGFRAVSVNPLPGDTLAVGPERSLPGFVLGERAADDVRTDGPAQWLLSWDAAGPVGFLVLATLALLVSLIQRWPIPYWIILIGVLVLALGVVSSYYQRPRSTLMVRVSWKPLTSDRSTIPTSKPNGVEVTLAYGRVLSSGQSQRGLKYVRRLIKVTPFPRRPEGVRNLLSSILATPGARLEAAPVDLNPS